MYNNTCKFLLILLVAIFATPYIVWSQDTLYVKLGPTSTTDNSLNNLRSSRVIINSLIPSNDFIIDTTQGEDRNADILGLREINSSMVSPTFIASNPVLQSNIVLLGHAGRSGTNLDDIINEEVGVISNSYAHHRFREVSQFVHEYNTISQLYAAFFNRNVDFIIVESSIAKSILNNAPRESSVKIINNHLFTVDVGFLINRDNEHLVDYLNTRISAFQNSPEYSTFIDDYYTIEREMLWLRYLMISTITIIVIIVFYMLIKNRGIVSNLLNSYSIQLNGIVQIRPLPSIKYLEDEASIKDSFKEKYSAFQLNNPGINTSIEFNGQAIKVTFSSEPDLKINSPDYLDVVAQELEDIIKTFPMDKFIIDLNISGQFQNFSSKSKFTYSNKGSSVDYIIQNK